MGTTNGRHLDLLAYDAMFQGLCAVAVRDSGVEIRPAKAHDKTEVQDYRAFLAVSAAEHAIGVGFPTRKQAASFISAYCELSESGAQRLWQRLLTKGFLVAERQAGREIVRAHPDLVRAFARVSEQWMAPVGQVLAGRDLGLPALPEDIAYDWRSPENQGRWRNRLTSPSFFTKHVRNAMKTLTRSAAAAVVAVVLAAAPASDTPPVAPTASGPVPALVAGMGPRDLAPT